MDVTPVIQNTGGFLISVEGISGAGKTSFANALAKEYELLDQKVIQLGGFEIHSYSSPLTIFCRDLVTSSRFVGLPWMAEIHLLIAELLFDVECLLVPALKEGRIVVFDGYWDSLVAFQSARIKVQHPEISSSAVEYLQKSLDLLFSFRPIPLPDCTIYLTCDIEKTKERLEARDTLPVTIEEIRLQKEIARQYDGLFRNRDILRIDNSCEGGLSENIQSALKFIQGKSYYGSEAKRSIPYL